MILCLGWGSLIWDPGNLPIDGDWRHDGPALPIEFARQSDNGRITLVIADDSDPVPVLWTSVDAHSLDDARQLLARREGISAKNVDKFVGCWSSTLQSSHRDTQSIGEWAMTIGAVGVVWTALKPKFGGMPAKPSCDQVVAYLSRLDGETKHLAEQYIRRAPSQIRTHYRGVIEHELGWTADSV